MTPQRADWRPLRIAMIGQKGLPATYGGVEHHVEQIGLRLAQRGHRVTVFGRRSYGVPANSDYLGMDVRLAPTVPSKHLDAIVHSASSTIAAIARGVDVIHYHALGPGLMAPLPRYASRAGVVLTVHGLDHERGKWGGPAKSVLGLAYWMSARVPQETIVVSEALRRAYQRKFGRDTALIPNGVVPPPHVSPELLAEFDVKPREYLLFVGRMVPEKAPAELLMAYRDVPTKYKLLLAGDSSFTDEYTERVRSLAAEDDRVRFLGYVHGDRLQALYEYARLFVLPSVLEGLPLTLLEAVSHGIPILASDIPPHREVLGDGGSSHTFVQPGGVDSLRSGLEQSLAATPDTADLQRIQRSVLDRYDWDVAADDLEQIYLRVART